MDAISPSLQRLIISKNWKLSRIRENAAMQTASKISAWDGNAADFEKWIQGIYQLGHMLNLKDYLDGSMIFPTEQAIYNSLESSDSEVVINLHNRANSPFDEEDDDGFSLTEMEIKSTTVREAESPDGMSPEQYEYMKQNLDVIFNVIWGSIKDSAPLMSVANVDGAMDKHDPILAIANIRSQYVLTSGLGLLAIFEELFALPTDNKETADLITSLEQIHKRLYDRGYLIDDIILVAMLTKCLKSAKLKDELNTKVTKSLLKKQKLSFSKAVEYVRLFENNRKSSITKSSVYKKSSSIPNEEGTKAMAVSKSTPAEAKTSGKTPRPCWNCTGLHFFNDCPNGCSKCKTFDHLAKDCPKWKQQKKNSAVVKTSSKQASSVVLNSVDNYNAMLDSGCNGNFIHDISLVNNYSTDVHGTGHVEFPDQSTAPIQGSGTVLGILDADIVPSMQQSLISVSELAKHGSVVVFDNDEALVIRLTEQVLPLLTQLKTYACTNSLVVLKAMNMNGLYRTHLPTITSKKVANAGYYYSGTKLNSLGEVVRFWHEVWNHASMDQMIHIVRGRIFDGLPAELTESAIRKYFPQCVECAMGNLTKTPLPVTGESIVKTPGDVVEIDYKGPITDTNGKIVKTFSGRCYSFVAVDVASDMTHVMLVKGTKHSQLQIQKLIDIYRTAKHPIKILRADMAFNTEPIRQLCMEHDILLQFSAPHEHGQLGHVERKHRTLSEQMVKVMARKPHVTPPMWGMAYLDCVYKTNLLPKERLQWHYPASLWGSDSINLRKTPMVPFGTIVMAHVPTKHQTGLGANSFEAIAVGCTPGTKGGLLLYNPKSKRTICRRTFKIIGPILPVASEPIHIELPRSTEVPDVLEDTSDATDLVLVNDTSVSDVPLTISDDEMVPIASFPESLLPPDDPVSATDNDYISLSSAVPTRPSPRTKRSQKSKKRKMSVQRSAVSTASPTSNPYQKFYPSKVIGSVQYSTDIPRCVQHIHRLPDRDAWLAALHSEIQSLITSGTFQTLSIPISDVGNHSQLLTQVIFDKRFNPDGTLKKYKARIVGRGDLQHWDTYQETYAGTANSRSVNIMLAIAAEKDLELEAVDIKTAFLYPDYIGPKLIVKRPSGLTDDDMPEFMELGKCIYGLKQAARAFREHLDSSLKGIGFIPTRADKCMYIKRTQDEYIMACAHVDDIGFAATSTHLIEDVKSQLSKIYELSVIKDMSFYLGMNITRDRAMKTIFVHQSGYVDSLQADYNVTYGKPPSTPMASDYMDMNKSFRPAQELISVDSQKDYMARVGSLLYLAKHTRPDILFAVTCCARKTQQPTIYDWNAVERILRYVAHTKDLGLSFHSGEGILLCATSDASYASHIDCKSHSGITLHLGRYSGSFHSVSKKQSITALSSTEAEFVATTEAAKEIIWARLLLYDLGFPQIEPTVLYEDNQSTIKLIGDESYHAKTKHIDVRFHFIREHCVNGEIRVEYLDTKNMTSDILTKPLGCGEFLHLRPNLLGRHVSVV